MVPFEQVNNYKTAIFSGVPRDPLDVAKFLLARESLIEAKIFPGRISIEGALLNFCTYMWVSVPRLFDLVGGVGSSCPVGFKIGWGLKSCKFQASLLECFV